MMRPNATHLTSYQLPSKKKNPIVSVFRFPAHIHFIGSVAIARFVGKLNVTDLSYFHPFIEEW